MKEMSAVPLASDPVHVGRVFTTSRDRIRLPNGRVVTFDVVRHGESVILLPMPDPTRIVLVRQYRYVIDQWIWELPAGSVDAGETAEAAASRECHEEIGQVPRRVELLGALYPTPGYCDEVMIFFKLEGLSTPATDAVPDEDELLHPVVFSVETALSMVDRGEIRDMKTALGLRMIR